MPDKDNPPTRTQSDKDIWDYATQDVTPIEKKSYNLDKLKHKPTIRKPQNHTPALNSPQPPPPNRDHHQPPQTDRRTEQRLKRGQFPIEGRIDLHGMTQNQAYDALCSYIPAAYGQGKRCILVITGKGLSKSAQISILDQKPGILRQKTPQWLNDVPLKQFILKIETAKQKDGGEGALYVLLRRKR